MPLSEGIRRALAWADENYARGATAEDMAKAAFQSRYHFQRRFVNETGTTPAVYLARKKVAHACRLLEKKRLTLTAAAHLSGFSSLESMNRAFVRVLGTGARQWTADSRNTVKFTGGTHMEHRIENMEPKKLAGIRCLAGGGTEEADITALWDEFDARCDDIPDVKDGHIAYGVCEYLPGGPGEGAECGTAVYPELAAAEVESFENLPMGMTARWLEGGKYAVFTVTMEPSGISRVYHEIYSRLLPEAGLAVDSRDEFEVYDSRWDPGTGRYTFEIWIPVL